MSLLRCSIARVAWPLSFSDSGIPLFRYSSMSMSHCAPAPLDRSTLPRANIEPDVEANDQLTASPGLSLPRAVRQPQPRSHPLYHVTSPSGRFLVTPCIFFPSAAVPSHRVCAPTSTCDLLSVLAFSRRRLFLSPCASSLELLPGPPVAPSLLAPVLGLASRLIFNL